MKLIKGSIVGSLLVGGVLLSGCGDVSDQENGNKGKDDGVKTEKFTYTKYELPLEDKVYLGDKDAEHEIVLVFDYSCPWCKKWMGEILPEIEEKFVDRGIAVYKGQPLVLLNQNSQYMANVDYNVEKYNPKSYYDVQKQFGKDSGNSDWAKDEYIKTVSKKFDLVDLKKLTNEEGKDIGIKNSRMYTRDFGVEYVPTVYVDGIKISDSFSIDEIEDVIEGTIKEGDVREVPVEE